MLKVRLKEAKAECARFLERVNALEEAEHAARLAYAKLSSETVAIGYDYSYSPKEQGAVRRSSLDLTRALAKLRSYER